MATNDMTVFSEFEMREMRIIFGEGDVYNVKCVSTVECESTVKNTVKKCRGVVAKKRTRATGEGTMKLTTHMPHECYIRLHDMKRDNLIEGVHAYGQNSLHPEVCITGEVLDEDENEKYKAWPRCTVSTGANSTIENGAETVEEVELEIGFMPDEYGEGFYETLVSELTDTNAKSSWLNAFTPDLVHETTPGV